MTVGNPHYKMYDTLPTQLCLGTYSVFYSTGSSPESQKSGTENRSPGGLHSRLAFLSAYVATDKKTSHRRGHARSIYKVRHFAKMITNNRPPT